MLLEPRVSDVLTTEENRSHYRGKPWKWEGKCLHATPPPFPAHPLISPSRSALRYQGFSPGDKRPLCARGGNRTPCRQHRGERGALLPPQPRRRARCQIQPGTGSRSLRARCSCPSRGAGGLLLPGMGHDSPAANRGRGLRRSSHVLGSRPAAWSHSPRGKPVHAPLRATRRKAAVADLLEGGTAGLPVPHRTLRPPLPAGAGSPGALPGAGRRHPPYGSREPGTRANCCAVPPAPPRREARA